MQRRCRWVERCRRRACGHRFTDFHRIGMSLVLNSRHDYASHRKYLPARAAVTSLWPLFHIRDSHLVVGCWAFAAPCKQHHFIPYAKGPCHHFGLEQHSSTKALRLTNFYAVAAARSDKAPAAFGRAEAGPVCDRDGPLTRLRQAMRWKQCDRCVLILF